MADLRMIGAIAAATVLVVAGGYWLTRSNQIASDYAAALADCKSGRGSAGIDALDSLYGESARPEKLSLDIAVCKLEAASAEVMRLDRLLDAAKAAD